jgi:hypothetical protein
LNKKTLENLMSLTQFSAEDLQVLQESATHTALWSDQFAQSFYDSLYSYPTTKVMFHEGERPAREKTIRDWYLRITSGKLDDNFWNDQWDTGTHHIKRHVHNSYIVGMMNFTQQFFLERCLAEFSVEKGQKVYLSLKRTTDIALGLITEGYHTVYAVGLVGPD